MRDIVLISFTPLNASGGVPRWNRDFVAGFPGTRHYCWDDCARDIGERHDLDEWEKASILNRWLIHGRKIKKDDIVIVDGFWGRGLESFDVISVCHGIWSHLTKEDADAGITPEFPLHHIAQLTYRLRHVQNGGRLVAVSDFISHQMNAQWGLESSVINNAVDLEKFRPRSPTKLDRPLVIHGATTLNKGSDHIDLLKRSLDADVMLLDQAADHFKMDKYDVLGMADLVVQPSAYEGNSYFILESLACDVPIVAYNVGLLFNIEKIARENGIQPLIGAIMSRAGRNPKLTTEMVKWILPSVMRDRSPYNPRQVASLFSIERFHDEWRKYLEGFERYLSSR